MDAVGSPHGGALHLEKRIPYGAGLGGGSSDAAATLLLLRDFWQVDISDNQLFDLAANLGSDVPFFLQTGPLQTGLLQTGLLQTRPAYATGRGELLEALVMGPANEPYQCPFTLLIVAPEVHVSTAEAYRNVNPNAEDRPDLKSLVASNDLEQWRQMLVNDFEASVFDAHPVLRLFKNRLLQAGAGYAAMSGSGSALFGVFERKQDARGLTAEFRREGVRSFECRVSSVE